MGCLFAASMLTTSCSLDEDPKGQMAQETYFTCQADLDASIHAIYEKLNQTQSWTNPMYPQWQGDDMTASPGSNKQAVAALDGFSSDGDNKGVTDAWKLHFALIKACNFVIEGAEKTPTSKRRSTSLSVMLTTGVHTLTSTWYVYSVRCLSSQAQTSMSRTAPLQVLRRFTISSLRI